MIKKKLIFAFNLFNYILGTIWIINLIKNNGYIRYIFKKCHVIRKPHQAPKGSLYLCNHPFVNLDKALILNFNPDACFVTNNGKGSRINAIINKLFFHQKNLIPTGGAVSKAIRRINDNKDVYIFYENPEDIAIKKSAKVIQEKTSCNVYLMNIQTNITKKFTKINHAPIEDQLGFWTNIAKSLILGTVIKISYKKVNMKYFNKKWLRFFKL